VSGPGARVVCLRCRTSDRTAAGGLGAAELAPVLAERLGVEAREIGAAGEAAQRGFDDDLRDARGCLLEAGGQVDDALADGAFPILTASDCSICITTLPTVARYFPSARFLWLDAHGDFNTPSTTGSGFLGGMCLAAACGRWDDGFEAQIDPASVTMVGVRDLDAGEQVELERAGVGAARPSQAAELLAGEPVFVHLDLDVLDPSVLPSQFPVDGGLSDTGLRTLLAEVTARSRVIGLEITAFEAPEDPDERAGRAAQVASIVAPLLPADGSQA
jgi:arginase